LGNVSGSKICKAKPAIKIIIKTMTQLIGLASKSKLMGSLSTYDDAPERLFQAVAASPKSMKPSAAISTMVIQLVGFQAM
jgi:hypothetical protein